MNILICGIAGKMGQTIYDLSKKQKDINVTDGLVLKEMLDECKEKFSNININFDINKVNNVDCVVDFSSHSATKEILDFCVSRHIPLVIGTTGHSEQELNMIKQASTKVAIFKANNMSQGVFVLVELLKKATQMLGNWDIEIIEKHHNQKVDAPSGTAIMMLNGVKEERKNVEVVVGRNEKSGKRLPNEVGVHSIRGGGIVGEHEIEFISENEVIKISHQAFSKQIFAEGALKAAKYLVNKPSGLYEMKNLF